MPLCASVPVFFMIKVLHIITRLEKGGSSRNVIYSAGEMKGFRNFVAYGKSDSQEDLAGLDPRNLFEIPELVREISPLRDLKAFLKIKKLIAELRPDVVHTHTSKAGALGRLAARACRKAGKPVIAHTPHGHLLYGYYGPLKTLAFRGAEMLLSLITDRFIALTEGEKKESSAAGIGRESRWEVIHSGVDFPKEVPSGEGIRIDLGLKKEDFLIGTIARLEKVKGVEIFIRAAAELERTASIPGAKYLVVGEGSLRMELKKLSEELSLGNKIIFAGFRGNVYDYLSAMDLYVQPSLNEAMGRTVLEAQFCGLPVIASDACGLPFLVKDNLSGLIFKKEDWADLAEKIRFLHSMPSILAEFSVRSRKSVMEKDENGLPRFSVEAMNAKLENFYAKIA